MMKVSENEANVEFSLKEYIILSILASEREADLKSRLDTCDRHKYIEISQLKAKLDSIINMIEFEKEFKVKKKESEKEMIEELVRLERSMERDE